MKNDFSSEFKNALQREFIERSKKNPAYSLRAFARQLGIDQSFLSKVLKGSRAVTPKIAAQIGPKLGLKPKEVKSIFSKGTAAMPSFLSLSDDEFDLLSVWHHFAIVELSKTEDFDSDPQWIGRRLGIHVQQVRDAITRLERLGFVRQSNKGFEVMTPSTTWTNTSTTSDARKKYQRTLIEKSLEAIDDVPFDLRENGSLTVAINKKRLPEFKERLREIRKELSDFLQADGEQDLDEVYQLTIALFPLSKVKGETP